MKSIAATNKITPDIFTANSYWLITPMCPVRRRGELHGCSQVIQWVSRTRAGQAQAQWPSRQTPRVCVRVNHLNSGEDRMENKPTKWWLLSRQQLIHRLSSGTTEDEFPKHTEATAWEKPTEQAPSQPAPESICLREVLCFNLCLSLS